MQFRLNEVTAKLLNVNPRPELHGEDKKTAADLKLEVMVPNKELGQFHAGLLHALYEKDAAQADLVSKEDEDHVTMLRYPTLGLPLKWIGEQVGGQVIVHRGIGPKSDLELDGVVVNEFRLEPIQGGTLGIIFRVQFHPEEKAIITVSVIPPQPEPAFSDEERAAVGVAA